MSPRSSSGSWSGARGADVIDLDKFMRGVRPPLPASDHHHLRSSGQLVVDAGGPTRKHVAASSSASTDSARPVAPLAAHSKRYSHDSGLSDGSYARRRHRPHRRVNGAEDACVVRPREARGDSDASLRAFRASCERALRDQQRQLARVSLLCERLGAQRDARPPREQSPDTTEISSSSCSTKDTKRKDKHRADECKTYKIIMTKLDELNRLFSARRASATPPPRRRGPPPYSGDSVSVSDKVVTTDVPVSHGDKIITVSPRRVERAAGGHSAARSDRGAGTRALTRAYTLDIAPADAAPANYANVLSESVVKCESGDEPSAAHTGDPRCTFDLEDPVHLYAQAKRLQALHVSTRRSRSAECGRASPRHRATPRLPSRGDASLCSLWRGYWRSLRLYLAAQMSCCPHDG